MADPAPDLSQLTDEQLDALIAQKQAEQNPSVISDIAQSTLPALAKTSTAIGTILPTMENMAAKGVNAAGNWAFPAQWKGSYPEQGASWLDKNSEPLSYPAVEAGFEKASGAPYYTAKTLPGKLWESALENAPLGMISPEASVPNVIRSMLSGAASTGAGELAKGTPYELPARIAAGAGAYGLSGAFPDAGIAVTTPRAAMAQTMERQGVPVSAAQITGSRLLASLEGHPPAGQAGAVSDVLKAGSGLAQPAGSIGPLSTLVGPRRAALSSNVQNLEANTSIPASPALRQQLSIPVATHYLDKAGTTQLNPQITDALSNYDTMTAGGALSGKNYHDLTDEWSSSGVPELRRMAGTLHGAMDNATSGGPYQGGWDQWRENEANFAGGRAEADRLGGSADFQPFSPKSVVDAMHRRTPMRDFAQAAQGITENNPVPYPVNHVVGALLSAPFAAHGMWAHGLAGAEEGTYPLLLGEYAPWMQKAVSGPVGWAARSRGGQAVLRNTAPNFDPNVASALLANQGVVPKMLGATSQPPQQPLQ